MSNIIYDCRWSKDLDEKFISDFCQVEQEVFHNDYSKEYFNHKFTNNIYGPSVLVVVYIDDAPSAARALWRNDIEGREAYQPGDTCVLEVCRGKGVFTEMTMRSIAMLPESAIIYNFPNHNSFPGYMKMGWQLLHDYRIKLFLTVDGYLKEHPIKMDDYYARWWVVGQNLLYTKKSGHYFLLQKDHRPFCYHVFSEVSRDIALSFPKFRIGFVFYKTETKTFYNSYFLPTHLVCRNTDVSYIPTWKIDAL